MVTIIWFFRISRPAAILLVPYIIWVSIASALNYGIYVLNP
jgi:benzodiazapine receptor